MKNNIAAVTYCAKTKPQDQAYLQLEVQFKSKTELRAYLAENFKSIKAKEWEIYKVITV